MCDLADTPADRDLRQLAVGEYDVHVVEISVAVALDETPCGGDDHVRRRLTVGRVVAEGRSPEHDVAGEFVVLGVLREELRRHPGGRAVGGEVGERDGGGVGGHERIHSGVSGSPWRWRCSAMAVRLSSSI